MVKQNKNKCPITHSLIVRNFQLSLLNSSCVRIFILFYIQLNKIVKNDIKIQ